MGGFCSQSIVTTREITISGCSRLDEGRWGSLDWGAEAVSEVAIVVVNVFVFQPPSRRGCTDDEPEKTRGTTMPVTHAMPVAEAGVVGVHKSE
jgi:hypothetical protein